MIYEVKTDGWLAAGWYVAGLEYLGPFETREAAQSELDARPERQMTLPSEGSMTPSAYRQTLASLGLSIVGAAEPLGISKRTSQRYAAEGVPHKMVPWMEQRFDVLRREPSENS